MFKNKLNKLIHNENNDDKNEGKNIKIENVVFLIILAVLTIIIINSILKGDKKSNDSSYDSKSKQLASTYNTSNSNNIEVDNNVNNIEERLENILSKIVGVGDVKALLNYSESSETIAMYNENSKSSITEETDDSGGVRKIEETDSNKEVIYKENVNGEKTPITKKIINPKIEGAIILAKGASKIEVKTSIIQAVEAVTGLPTHKIQVFEMN